ncbi:MAG: F0F1 ATP synthase subunit A [Actinomycetota bacterium]
MIFGLEFPPIENLVEWPNWFGPKDSWYGFNKIAFISLVAIVATSVLFILGNRKRSMVPKGAQNLVESSVAFIRDGIVLETMGPDGIRYLPYLVSLFFFILVGNIFEVIPFFHMPANARMAGPAVLALITWAYYIAVGLKHQGPKYFINAIAPPGVPKALYILVVPIEFLSTFIVRPFSLAVRLFANMLAGHILLVTFSVLCITLFTASLLALVLPLSFFMLVALTGFEVMVAFLQAYIFTILAAVYIGSSMHAEH